MTGATAKKMPVMFTHLEPTPAARAPRAWLRVSKYSVANYEHALQ
jgi:hypothetical protein